MKDAYHYFLQGNGEMAQLMRATDWNKTPLGDPATWPHSLRTMVSVMLDNPFGMYIAWGDDYTQLYNDGYRPILGSNKHPHALGSSSRETFSEIWHIIGPMFQGVMDGQAVGFPDLMLPLNRNGFIEECYFDFSYSPIRKDNGEVGGVLVTVIETTNKKKTELALKQSEQRFRDTVKQAPIGITILRGKDFVVEMANDAYLQLVDRKTTEFVGRPLFDSLPEVKESVQGLLEGVMKTGVPFHGYEVPIPLLRSGKQDIFYFDFLYHPLREMDGEISGILVTVTEVSEKVATARKIKENENLLQSIFFNAPAAIAVVTGAEHTYVLANSEYQQMVNRTSEQLIGNISKDIFPELTHTGTFEIFDNIYKTGEAFSVAEYPVVLKNTEGNMQQMYFRFSAVPLKNTEDIYDTIVIVAVDITEHVESRKKVEESEQRFQLLVQDTSAAIIVLTGEEMKVEIVNDAYGRLFNVTSNELIGNPLFSVIPEAANYYHPILEKVRQTGEMIQLFDSPYSGMSNGKKIEGFLHVVYQPYRDGEGNTLGVMAMMQDVTETVVARKKLEQSEKKFEAAIQAVEGITWTNNEKGEMVGEQTGWSALTGQHYDEYQGYGWAKVVHPEDAQPTVDAWNLAVLHKTTFKFEHRLLTKLNGWRYFSVKAVPVLDENSIIEQWVGVHTDITERRESEQKIKESEERFRLLADFMPQHIWTADPEGNLNYYNQSVFDYAGLTPQQLEENGWLHIVHPDDREQNIIDWMDSINTGKDFIFEHRFRRHDGEYQWQLSRAIPLKDEHGKIQMWIGTSTNIQDQKIFTNELEKQVNKRTKELANSNMELEKMNKELQSFAYISSHDLQEPLRKIQTFASQIIEKEFNHLSDSGKDKFVRMQNAARRMQVLIDDLLAYSRTNTNEGKFEKTNLNLIVEEVKEDLREELIEKNAILDTNQLCETYIIPFQFRQLLHNLIGNALKFSRPAIPPLIVIKSEIVDGAELNDEKFFDQSKYCHISIKDNGIGFEQKYSEKIFEVFQRLHGQNEYKGTGIGLSIVKKIVENHNGIIKVESELDKGSTFNIYLPAK